MRGTFVALPQEAMEDQEEGDLANDTRTRIEQDKHVKYDRSSQSIACGRKSSKQWTKCYKMTDRGFWLRLMGKKNRENAKLCTIIEFVGRELIE